MLSNLEQDIHLVWMFVLMYVEFFAGLAAALGLVGMLWLIYYLEGRYNKKRKALFNQSIRTDGKRWMSTPEEENLEKVLISDAVVDGIEELIYRGKLSPERARMWYRRFGNLLNLPDLLQEHEQLLKERIIKSLGNVKVIPFPDVRKGNRMLERMRTKKGAKNAQDNSGTGT